MFLPVMNKRFNVVDRGNRVGRGVGHRVSDKGGVVSNWMGEDGGVVSDRVSDWVSHYWGVVSNWVSDYWGVVSERVSNCRCVVSYWMTNYWSMMGNRVGENRGVVGYSVVGGGVMSHSMMCYSVMSWVGHRVRNWVDCMVSVMVNRRRDRVAVLVQLGLRIVRVLLRVGIQAVQRDGLPAVDRVPELAPEVILVEQRSVRTDEAGTGWAVPAVFADAVGLAAGLGVRVHPGPVRHSRAQKLGVGSFVVAWVVLARHSRYAVLVVVRVVMLLVMGRVVGGGSGVVGGLRGMVRRHRCRVIGRLRRVVGGRGGVIGWLGRMIGSWGRVVSRLGGVIRGGGWGGVVDRGLGRSIRLGRVGRDWDG